MWIGCEAGGLDEGRMGNRVCGLGALMRCLADFDSDGNEFGRTFSITHDRLRELYRDLRYRLLHCEKCRAGSICDGWIVCTPSADQNKSIISGSIPVHSNPVEGIFRCVPYDFFQKGLTQIRIGRDVTQ